MMVRCAKTLEYKKAPYSGVYRRLCVRRLWLRIACRTGIFRSIIIIW